MSTRVQNAILWLGIFLIAGGFSLSLMATRVGFFAGAKRTAVANDPDTGGVRMSNWETDDQGNVVYAPLVNFHAAPMAGILCAVRIEFARTPAQLAEGLEHLQLALTPVQARQLAGDLLQIAEKIDNRLPGQRQH
jgi:hypothetical protein